MARSPRSGAPTRTRPAGGGRGGSGRPPGGGGVTPAPARAEAEAPRKRTDPVTFFREVRAEGRKVTWTSWKETWITSIMVLIMVSISALFLFLVDLGLSSGIQFVLTLPERFT